MPLLSTQIGRIRGYFDISQAELLQHNVWRSCIHLSMKEVIGGRANPGSVGITRRGHQTCTAVQSAIVRHGGEFTRVSDLQIRGYFRTEQDAYYCARSIQTMMRDRRSLIPYHFVEVAMGLSSGVCLRRAEANVVNYYGSSVGFASWLSTMDTKSEICVSLTFFKRLGKVAPKLQQEFIPSSITVKGYVNAVSYFNLDARKSEPQYRLEWRQ